MAQLIWRWGFKRSFNSKFMRVKLYCIIPLFIVVSISILKWMETNLFISFIIFLIANISWSWRLTRVAFSFLINWLIQEFLEMMLAQASSGLNDEKLDIEDIFKVMKKLFFFRPFIDLFLISPCSFGGSYPLLFLSGVRPEWRWTNFWRRAQDDNGQSWWGPHRRRGKKADWRKKVLRNFKDFG